VQKILAMSDLHLNFGINPGVRRKFFNQIKGSNSPIIIAGDIGDGHSLRNNLEELASACQSSVYFITGNHDYYHSGFEEITNIIRKTVSENPNLVYLTDSGIISLDTDTCVVGVDSWYDAKIVPEGAYLPMIMNDFRYIKELCLFYKSESEVVKTFQDRAETALEDLKTRLSKAVKRYKNVIVVSHPVPFGCMDTKKSSDAAPFYVWYKAGMFIADFAKDHQETKFLWICGHTHERSEWHNENLDAYCLGSEYFSPRVDAVITDLKLEYLPIK